MKLMLLTSINHTDVQLVSSEHDIMPGHQIIILKSLDPRIQGLSTNQKYIFD